jgi:hypothetical protein
MFNLLLVQRLNRANLIHLGRRCVSCAVADDVKSKKFKLSGPTALIGHGALEDGIHLTLSHN